MGQKILKIPNISIFRSDNYCGKYGVRDLNLLSSTGIFFTYGYVR